MLILRRKSGESIVIGEQINVTVLDINEGSVRLAIDAPKVIPILRSELLQAANLNRDAASAEQSTSRGLLELLGKPDAAGAVKPKAVRPGAARRKAVPATEPTPEAP